jgi:hypothetical protein
MAGVFGSALRDPPAIVGSQPSTKRTAATKPCPEKRTTPPKQKIGHRQETEPEVSAPAKTDKDQRQKTRGNGRGEASVSVSVGLRLFETLERPNRANSRGCKTGYRGPLNVADNTSRVARKLLKGRGEIRPFQRALFFRWNFSNFCTDRNVVRKMDK